MRALPRQGDEVALEAGGFIGDFEVMINLVEVAADAHEHAARSHGGKIIILKFVVAVEEVLDAVGLGPEFAAVEDVDVILLGGALVTADEMAGQPDAGDGQAEAAREEQVGQAEIDGIAGAAVNDTVQVAVLGIVIVLLVAFEAEVLEEIIVESAENLVGVAVKIETLAEFTGVAVEEGLVGLDVDVWILRLREQPGGFLEVQVLALLEAEGEKPVVSRPAGEILDDFLGTPAEGGIGAERVRPQPVDGVLAAGKNLVADDLVDGGVFVAEEIDEGGLLAFREWLGTLGGGGGAHGLLAC